MAEAGYPWDVDALEEAVLSRTGDEYAARAVAARVRDMIRLDAGVPEHLKPGILRYVVDGIEPGRFLRCVLENDLTGAVNRCNDPVLGLDVLRRLVNLLYNGTPSNCWGTTQRVSAWIEQRGLVGDLAG